MISFFFKKSKIVLDCFTCVPEIAQLFPIIPAEERIPSFWKNLPTTVKHQGPMRGTMKTCPGVSTLFTSGFIIQNWSDIWLGNEPAGLTWYPENAGEAHHPKQWGNAFKGFNHVKLVSPWRIKEKTGVNFLYTNCFWHDDEFKPVIVNGVVEYKYQHTTSVNMLVPKKMFPSELTVPAGKELAHVIPLSEKEIVINSHEVSPLEFERLNAYGFTFSGQYFKRKKLLKQRGL